MLLLIPPKIEPVSRVDGGSLIDKRKQHLSLYGEAQETQLVAHAAFVRAFEEC